MARACEMLGIPVVSGNVSLYNETDGRAIPPTPVVGCVGLVADVRLVPSAWREGDVVLLAGRPTSRARRLRVPGGFLGGPAGRPPPPDYVAEAALVHFLWRSARHAERRARRRPDGGLAVALAELALRSGIGAELELERDALAWFGEGSRPGGRRLPARAGGGAGRECRSGGSASSGGAKLLGVALAELRPPTREASPDVRHRRHPRSRPRRRAALLLRALRPAAPRPGVGGDRRLRRGAADRPPGHGPRQPGLLRGEAPRAARPDGDRPLPLLDDRLDAVDERAADRPARPGTDGRARAQRQPHEHRRSSGTSSWRGASGSPPPPTPR